MFRSYYSRSKMIARDLLQSESIQLLLQYFSRLSAKISLQASTVPSRIVGVFLILMLVISIAVLTLKIDSTYSIVGGESVFYERDFSKTPFGLMDAYDACVLESKAKMGSGMLRNHILPLSTRYNHETDEYFVVLSADVGSVHDWSEAMIYCTIDVEKEMISHYKEIHDENSSLLSRTMSMLSDVLK